MHFRNKPPEKWVFFISNGGLTQEGTRGVFRRLTVIIPRFSLLPKTKTRNSCVLPTMETPFKNSIMTFCFVLR